MLGSAEKAQKVVPLVGTWIEIMATTEDNQWVIVVPLVGTWIEIPTVFPSGKTTSCRPPRGDVD